MQLGIVPLTFKNPADYDKMAKGTKVVLRDVRKHIEQGDREIPVDVDDRTIITVLDVSDRQRKHLLAGGTLNFVKEEIKKKT